jgi:ABC-type glycerol-3-phosphate transport system substrate-binding protein
MKIGWKKITSIILTMAMVFSTAACGSGGSKNQSTVDPETAPHITLALRSGIYADAIESCLVEFEEENQVICDVLKLGEEELHTGITDDAANSEGAYDLCMVDGSWMAEFTSKNILLNLSEQGYELDSDIIEATKTICYKDGNVYLAPYYGNVTVLLYNRSVVHKAGFDGSQLTSLEAMKTVCEKAKKSGNFGFMYRGDSENNYVVDFLPILLSYGGWVVDENNKPTVNTPEFKEAMEFYLELIKTGKAESRDNLIMAIANGAAAMAVGWPGWYTPTAKSSSDYIALTGKATDDSVAYNANVYGIWTIGIPKNSANKDISIKLLKYLMDPEVQKATIEAGGVPCRYSCLTDPEVLKENPPFEAVFEALENGVYRPVMEEWPDFYKILGSEMGKIISGAKTVDEGLQDAQTQLDELLP